MQQTTSLSYHRNGRSSIEIISGDTPDISNNLDFGLYYWVLYKNNAGYSETKLDKMFGISLRVGPMMSYILSCYILYNCAEIDITRPIANFI
jgi:hypothetical protein